MTVSMKRGDQRPSFTSTLQSPPGTPIDLTGATVKFRMMNDATGELKVDEDAIVLDETAGRVGYSWATNDTDTAGLYKIEWEITFSDTTKLTVPNQTYLYLRIVPDLAAP